MCNTVRMSPIEDKMQEMRLRWFRHVRRRLIDMTMRRVDEMEEVCSKRWREGSKKTCWKTLNDLIKNMIWIEIAKALEFM